MSCKDHTLSSSLQFKGFYVDEEVNNMMNGTLQEESDGYMCNIFYGSNSDGTMRRGFSDSKSEGWDEEGNGEKSRNEVIMKMEKGTLASCQKVGVLDEVWNVSLWMMLGCSL
jgi:hypothetical protein